MGDFFFSNVEFGNVHCIGKSASRKGNYRDNNLVNFAVAHSFKCMNTFQKGKDKMDIAKPKL